MTKEKEIKKLKEENKRLRERIESLIDKGLRKILAKMKRENGNRRN